MFKFRRLLPLMVATLCTSNVFAHDLPLTDTKSLTLDSKQLSELSIEAGAGDIKLVGTESELISVEAKIYQRKAHNEFVLSLTQHGEKAKLKSLSGSDHKHQSNNDEMYIDLVISMPQHLALAIADGSGDIDVSNIKQNVAINDGSGAIMVDNITGMLTINDGSGSITASNVKGNVTIHDGSGGIIGKSLQSDVTIIDGSGAIELSQVVGNVTVTDGSGAIDVDGAENFTLAGDGSGGVHLQNIRGTIIR